MLQVCVAILAGSVMDMHISELHSEPHVSWYSLSNYRAGWVSSWGADELAFLGVCFSDF